METCEMCSALISDGISERMLVDGQNLKVCFDCFVVMMWD